MSWRAYQISWNSCFKIYWGWGTDNILIKCCSLINRGNVGLFSNKVKYFHEIKTLSQNYTRISHTLICEFWSHVDFTFSLSQKHQVHATVSRKHVSELVLAKAKPKIKLKTCFMVNIVTAFTTGKGNLTSIPQSLPEIFLTVHYCNIWKPVEINENYICSLLPDVILSEMRMEPGSNFLFRLVYINAYSLGPAVL
jgi:hypothetical protein